MTDRLISALSRHASGMDASLPQPRWGLVQTVDPVNQLARVLLQPEGVLTGWLPLLSPQAGPGWGLLCPPQEGQQVLVLPDGADHDSGVILGGTWDTQGQPPQPAKTPGGSAAPVVPGEAALVHQSGTYLRVNGDGTVMLNTASHLNATVGGNATVSSQGPMLVSSEQSLGLQAPAVTGGASDGSPLRLATETFVLDVFNAHTHPGDSGGTTGVPNQQATSADLTTNFKAD